MGSANIQYIEISSLSIIMLLIVLCFFKRSQKVTYSFNNKAFSKMLISNAFILFADMMILVFERNISKPIMVITHIMCIIYFLLHAYFGYLWFNYCINTLYPDRIISKKEKLVLLIPCFVSSVLILASPFTGWIYAFNEKNLYVRGKYIAAVIVLSYLYWILSQAIIVFEAIKRTRLRENSTYVTLLVFSIPTVIANIVQLKYYGYSVVWICTSISLLVSYLNFINNKLSRDNLTGLFNRSRADQYIKNQIKHHKGNSVFYVAFADLDHFKDINDTFGHSEGDKAIVKFASILTSTCSNRDFIGRSGGDEYIVCGNAKSIENIEDTIDKINHAVTEFNKLKLVEYSLSVSIGYSVLDENNTTLESLLRTADKEMYRIKDQKKVLR